MLVNRIKSILSAPAVYQLFQSLIGAQRYYERCYTEFVRPKPGERILEIGCGPAVALDYLPASIDYTGIDISQEYIDAARKKHGGRGEFICAAISGLNASKFAPFDRAVASGVLHHLDDATAHAMFRFARSVVRPGGWIVTVDPSYTPGQSRLAKFVMDHDRGCHIRDLAGYHRLAEPYGEVEAFLATGLIRISTYSSAIMRLHLTGDKVVLQ